MNHLIGTPLDAYCIHWQALINEILADLRGCPYVANQDIFLLYVSIAQFRFIESHLIIHSFRHLHLIYIDIVLLPFYQKTIT